MEKSFAEAFPNLKLNPTLNDLFKDTVIYRMSSNAKREFLNIYLKSNHLIEKSEIYKVEKELFDQNFGQYGMQVRIFECFELSNLYTVERVMELYRESILTELKRDKHVEYIAFKNVIYNYDAETGLDLEFEDNILIRTVETDFKDYLLKVFNERFGFDIKINFAYREIKTEDLFKGDDIEIKRKVEAIKAGLEEANSVEQGAETNGIEAAKPEKKASEKKATGEKPVFKRSDTSTKRTGDYTRTLKGADDPNLILGKNFEVDAFKKIEDIIGEIGEVTIHGQIMDIDFRPLKSGEKTLVFFNMTDFTDTIGVKIFVRNEFVDDLMKDLKPGNFIELKGIVMLDKYDHELSIASVLGIKKGNDFTIKRMDTSAYKRVELHCHTKMSEMDGVSETSDIVKCAYRWGHKAIAITDHGVVHGFPDALHTLDSLWDKEKAKCKEAGTTPNPDDFFKVIYGTEAYFVDDLLEACEGDLSTELSSDFTFINIRTTGLSVITDSIFEIGAVRTHNGEVVSTFSEFVNPMMPIPFNVESETHVNDSMVIDAPVMDEILPRFIDFADGSVLVVHDGAGSINFLKSAMEKNGREYNFSVIDTLYITMKLLSGQAKHTMEAVSKTYGIKTDSLMRAVDVAKIYEKIFARIMKELASEDVKTLADINSICVPDAAAIKHMPTYHAIILAKNDLGRINLYRLISESHLNYYNRMPRMPKSLVRKYRDGLILGSACEAGELYRALLSQKSDRTIANIVDFYDYLEIQPVGNNAFMIESDKMPNINSFDDIRELNKKIVELGERFNKPVVATCDVHFLNPEDEVYRRIIMAGKGFDDADKQAPLYLHTTDEMLEEFSYLGSDKAFEIVVKNTNLIADMIEHISPVRPDKCPPVIPNSDKILTQICENRAHEIYGQNLPVQVSSRLEKELNSIIKNGFAVMYIIAQKLVWKSVEDGYLVGSRGSVGSSFVATMAGITEVNPLSPHYYCSKCHYYDFESEEVKAYGGKAGVDMPDKVCPVCGEPLCKDGFDIPFETFLGFKGDKEPDIDLNFSGEYQSKAHKYTEVIFGAGQTFRAGTLAALADKTAFGFVKKYFEEHDIHKRGNEVARIAIGCTGVRRSTGQHPGGIVVLPVGEDINSFTPVQHPANDTETDTITTHFDYHSIDHNLLKLDILGHDDPTMIRMLQDLTGRDPLSIPLDGKDVMSLFQNTSALGITPDDIGGCPLGALGIPEFGTDFAMQMLVDTKPQAFSDLVRISGLSHGTDVWLGNAETLIKSGKATISTAICTRDDIMLYLISKGIEPETSFKIMENVRKGKVAKKACPQWADWKADMLKHDVPEWYAWSCEKIAYMFPKAHAAAYVMMAWRIAYCKIHYPQAYYAAYFSIRAKAFDYSIMCQGRDYLEKVLADYKSRMDDLSKKEQDVYSDMRIVQEMYARGFEFMPIDIFKVKARLFQVIDGKVMPSLTSIQGLGEKAADNIVWAAKDGEFLSREDFMQRTKASKNITELMYSLGLLGDIPESNQISLFDLF